MERFILSSSLLLSFILYFAKLLSKSKTKKSCDNFTVSKSSVYHSISVDTFFKRNRMTINLNYGTLLTGVNIWELKYSSFSAGNILRMWFFYHLIQDVNHVCSFICMVPIFGSWIQWKFVEINSTNQSIWHNWNNAASKYIKHSHLWFTY